MTRKLLILSQYFPPEMGAPQARLSELGSRLKALGWQVQVLTALPNYPTGQIFPGYKHARYVRETVDGLDTIRVSLIPSASRAAFPRLRCYLSFAWSVLRLGRKICDRPDLIYVESPPLFLGPTGEMLARWWRIRYVINISDLWPESFVQMDRLRRSTVIYRMLRKVEIRCYRRAAAVTGQSSDIASSVRSAAPDAEVELITNAVDPLIFGPFRRESARRRELGWEGKCVFMYAGLHGFAQGLDQIIRAASMLQSKPDIHFAFIGEGPTKSALQVMAANLPNVSFHSAVERRRVATLLASADAAIITLGAPIHGAVPSKIYEAMASAVPIVLMAGGEAAERVHSAGAGLIVSCGDIIGLTAAVERLAGDPQLRRRLGQAGRSAVEMQYTYDQAAQKLSELLARVAEA
jgi:glycosyltransferase involved in cell wall biosynthesis